MWMFRRRSVCWGSQLCRSQFKQPNSSCAILGNSNRENEKKPQKLEWDIFKEMISDVPCSELDVMTAIKILVFVLYFTCFFPSSSLVWCCCWRTERTRINSAYFLINKTLRLTFFSVGWKIFIHSLSLARLCSFFPIIILLLFLLKSVGKRKLWEMRRKNSFRNHLKLFLAATVLLLLLLLETTNFLFLSCKFAVSREMPKSCSSAYDTENSKVSVLEDKISTLWS